MQNPTAAIERIDRFVRTCAALEVPERRDEYWEIAIQQDCVISQLLQHVQAMHGSEVEKAVKQQPLNNLKLHLHEMSQFRWNKELIVEVQRHALGQLHEFGRLLEA